MAKEKKTEETTEQTETVTAPADGETQKLLTKIDELNLDNKKLSKHVEALQKEKIRLEGELKKSQDELSSTKKDLEDRINSAEPAKQMSDCVVLDGQFYKISHRNMVKELVEDYKKRLVPEDHTAIIIDKIGG